MSKAVVPITPDIVPLGSEAQALAEHAVLCFHEFVKDYGNPAGMALVIIGEDGTSDRYWHVLDGTHLRGFLAYAGARLTTAAVEDVD